MFLLAVALWYVKLIHSTLRLPKVDRMLSQKLCQLCILLLLLYFTLLAEFVKEMFVVVADC